MKLERAVTESNERYWVTDDEQEQEETDAETESEGEQRNRKPEKSPGWWRRALQRLPRFKVRGEKQWQVGQRCLVMTGKAGCDEGQVVIITERKPCLVEIAFLGPDGKIRRKAKRPGSLIGLRPGVTVVQEADGTIWVQADERERKKKKERDS
jgi:hypothetical protein